MIACGDGRELNGVDPMSGLGPLRAAIPTMIRSNGAGISRSLSGISSKVSDEGTGESEPFLLTPWGF